MALETDLQKHLMLVAANLRCQFTLQGSPIQVEKVFSPVGLLPSFLRRADQLCSFCLGYNLGATFERSEGALLGSVVILDDKVAMSLRLLCVLDVLAECVQQVPSKPAVPGQPAPMKIVPLDSMLAGWRDGATTR